MYASTSYRTSGPIRLAVAVAAAATTAVLGVQADQASAAASVAGAGAAGIVSTIAGGPGGPGPARRVAITVCGKFISQGGCGFSFAAGNLYVTDLGWPNSSGDVVRQVNMRTGRLTTLAGDGQPGFGGDDGPATQ